MDGSMRIVMRWALQRMMSMSTVGTFFSVRNPQNALRSFGVFLHKVDWTKSEYLKDLFLPFMYLGTEKPIKEKE